MTPPRIFGWTGVSTAAQAKDDRASLPAQRQMIEEYTHQIGGKLVQVAIVPGHSRNYQSLGDMRDAFREDKITALEELIEALERDRIDMVVVADADRFARRQAPFAEIVHRIIDSGKVIHCLADNFTVDEQKADMFIAMRGFFVASDVRRLKEKHKHGTANRVEHGLHGSGLLLMSHKMVRDPITLEKRLELDESKRRLWDDLATLILEGVAWNLIEGELFKRFGHADPITGKAWPFGKMHHMVHNPYFWGHAARHYFNRTGTWVYDESAPVPPGVQIKRNTVPAVWTGALAEQIKAELIRRSTIVCGRTRPGESHRFTGLLVCDECGSRMTIANPRGTTKYWGCLRHTYTYLENLPECHNRRYLRDDVTEKWIDKWLRKVITAEDIRPFFDEPVQFSAPERAERIKAERDNVEIQIQTLIRAQAKAGLSDSIQAHYEKEIELLDQQLQALERSFAEASRVAGMADRIEARRQAVIGDIKEIGIDGFWKQTPTQINQQLLALLANCRFAVRDRTIVAVVPYVSGGK